MVYIRQNRQHSLGQKEIWMRFAAENYNTGIPNHFNGCGCILIRQTHIKNGYDGFPGCQIGDSSNRQQMLPLENSDGLHGFRAVDTIGDKVCVAFVIARNDLKHGLQASDRLTYNGCGAAPLRAAGPRGSGCPVRRVRPGNWDLVRVAR